MNTLVKAIIVLAATLCYFLGAIFNNRLLEFGSALCYLTVFFTSKPGIVFTGNFFRRPMMRYMTNLNLIFGAISAGMEIFTGLMFYFGAVNVQTTVFFLTNVLIHPLFYAHAFVTGRFTGADAKIVLKAHRVLKVALFFNTTLTIFYLIFGSIRVAGVGFVICVIDFILIMSFVRLPLPRAEEKAQ